MASLADPKRHKRFYFSDGTLCLLVEKSLYRVHRSLLEIHATKFPRREPNACGGETHVLEDVKAVDFDRLLACLYPRTLFVEEAETTEEWISILTLSSKWGFESLRSRAMSRIGQTLSSPVDMVVVGRQYDIQDILLQGYATLCQGSTPLSSEEGRRLGVDDVVNIYRIRHELYGSVVTHVSLEDVLRKVRTLLSNKEPEDNQDSETELPDSDLDGEQTSEWTNMGSDAEAWMSVAEWVASSTPGTHAIAEGSYRQQWTDLNIDSQQTLFNVLPASTESFEAETVGPVLGQHHTNMFFPDGEHCESFDKLTMDNFGPISADIVRWIQAESGGQRLYHITRMSVKKAIEEPEKANACILLCKKMTINLKEKKFLDKGNRTKGETLFCRYLGEICRETLTGIVASTAIVDRISDNTSENATCSAKDRRQGLVEVMARLTESITAVINLRPIVNKWITSLLDTYDEEKIVTLCLLLIRTGRFWDNSNEKLRACMDRYFEKITEIAQTTYSPQIRTLLQDVIKCRERGWGAA